MTDDVGQAILNKIISLERVLQATTDNIRSDLAMLKAELSDDLNQEVVELKKKCSS